MGFKDKYQAFDAISGIDDKYIKSADKLIMERLNSERDVIRLRPEPKHFSWKQLTAAAACAAVIIGGGIFVGSYVNRISTTNPPIDNSSGSLSNSSSTSKPILDEPNPLNSFKERNGIKIDTAYAKDEFKVTKYTLPWMNGVSDSAAYVSLFADENHAVKTSYWDEGDVWRIELYTLDTGEFERLYDSSHDPGAYSEASHFIIYLDKDMLVFRETTMSQFRLHVIDLRQKNEDGSYSHYATDRTDSFGDSMVGTPVVNGENIYIAFAQSNKDSTINTSAKPSMYAFSIENGKLTENKAVEEGVPLCVYNGDLVYYTRDAGDSYLSGGNGKTLHSLNGGLPIEGKTVSERVWGSSFGIFELLDGKTFINSITGEIIFDKPTGSELLYNNTYSDFGIAFSDFIYDAEANKVLITYDKGLSAGGDAYVGFSGGFYMYRGHNGSTSGSILTKQKPADTEKPRSQEYLDKFRKDYNVGDNVKVAYARDRLNITEFTLPDNTVFSAEALEKYQVIDETRLLTADDNSQIGVRQLDGSGYKALYKTADDPYIEDGDTAKIKLRYTTRSYAVFEIAKYRKGLFISKELRLIDLDTSAVETVVQSDQEESSMASYFAVSGDILYFSNALSLMEYKIHGNEQAKFIKMGTEPFIYNGEAHYWKDISQDGGGSPMAAFSINGDTAPIDKQMFLEYFDVMIGRDFIVCYNGGTLIDAATGEAIISNESNNTYYRNKAFDFGVFFQYKDDHYCIYNAHTNEILVFEEDDAMFSMYLDMYFLNNSYDGLFFGYKNRTGFIITEKAN